MSGRSLAAVLAALALAGSAGCGDDAEPLRVGLLRDCSGLLGSTKDGAVAGAELPLIQRGAQLHREGELANARIGNVKIELVPACTEVTQLSQLIAETRWLVETKHAEVVIGPLGTGKGR